MNVLGISGGVSAGNQDGAAALLVSGELVAAAEEERFVGIKFANGRLPTEAIRFCLKQANLGIKDLDAVVYAGATYVDIEETLRRYLEFQFGHSPRICLVDHHEAHAASAFFANGAHDSLVVTWDNSGDGRSTTVWEGRQGELTLLDEYRRPNSLGLFYSAVTQFLGFTRDSDEYKVMGMSAYGRDRFSFDHILEVTPTGYRFRGDFLRGLVAGKPQPPKQLCLFDEFPLPEGRRQSGEEFLPVHFDVATSAQAQLERAAVALVSHWLKRTELSAICLAGGVALNCLLNQSLRELPGVERLYVPPCSSDAGLSVGAAYLVAKKLGDKLQPLRDAYTGPETKTNEIRSILDRAGADYREIDDPAIEAARLISQDKIVGWFQGRMEFGPRALGSRSILANPRVADMKDWINQRVKFREEYRPLAPSVLHESGPDYFEDYADSPYMTQTFHAHPSLARCAPAVVHQDGTSRIQSVHESTNKPYARLIKELDRLNGLPMVLNTSLNAYNDPIACYPHQALRTYFGTGLDALVVGDFLLEKKASK